MAGGSYALRLCSEGHDPKITGVESIVDTNGRDITGQCGVSIDRHAFAVNIGVPENVDVSNLKITYAVDKFSETGSVLNGGHVEELNMIPAEHGAYANYTKPRVLTYFRGGPGGSFPNDCWQNWTVTVTKTQGVYSVTVTDGQGGGAFQAGQPVTVQAEEKAGMRFLAWRAEGLELAEAQRAASPMTFTMPNNAVTLTALYEPVQSQVDLTITAPAGGQALDDAATVTTPSGEAELPVQWTPTAPAAGFNTEYTAVVTISTGSYSFSQDVAATVNGAAAQVTRVDDYTIAVSYTFQTAKARLLSVTPVTLTGVANGTSLTDIVAQLGDRVGIQSDDASTTTASVAWDTDSVRYTQAAQFEQIIAVKGTVTLPDYMDANGVDLTVFAQVTVAGLERVSYARMRGAMNCETYTTPQTVEFESDTQGATIYYTLTDDGSKPATPVPGAAGTKEYTGPVTLDGVAGKTVNYRFKTIAVKNGMTDSATQYYTVTISRPEPTYTVSVTDGAQVCGLGSGTYHAGDLVTVKIADVDPDRLFTGWTATGISLSDPTAETFTFEMPAGDVTITASFRNKVKSVELTDPLAVTEGSALPAAGDLSAAAKDKNGELLTDAVTAQLYAWTPGDTMAGYGKTYTAFILLHPANGLNLIADEVQVTLNGKTYTAGRVEGSSDFLLSVSFDTARDTLERIDWPGNMTLYVGDTLTLPQQVSVTTTHNTLTSAELYWEGAGSVNTAAAGAYTLTAAVYLPGTVNTTGVALSTTITVTVASVGAVEPVRASFTENLDHSGEVTLSCGTAGAAITYTLNGGESQTYSGPIPLAAPEPGKSELYTITVTATKQLDAGHAMVPSTATFRYILTTPRPTYGVTVTSGKLGETSQTAGDYAQGDTVAIVAALDSGTQLFKEWKITKADGVTDVTEELLGRNKTTDKTSFLMPDYAVRVTASVEAKIDSVTLSFIEPTSVSDLPAAATCTINDTNYPVALAWSTADGAEENTLSCTATVTLRPNPARDLVFADSVSVTINSDAAVSTAPGIDGTLTITTKVYTLDKPAVVPTLYAVTMKNSVDSSEQTVGSYPAGSTVTIAAPARAGYQFTGWTVEGDTVTLADASKSVTTFPMPGSAVTVTANYVPEMSHVKLELAAPAAGQPLAQKVTKLEISADGAMYRTVSPETLDRIVLSWYPGGEAAAFGTTYRGGIVLRPKTSENYVFSQTVRVSINGGDFTEVAVNADGSVNLYGTFSVPKAKVLSVPESGIAVENGTTETDAKAKLPTQLTISTEKGPMTVAVGGWSISGYHADVPDTYTATASTMALPTDVDLDGKTVTATVAVWQAVVATPRAVPLGSSESTLYVGSVEVSLYCDTVGAAIYYTLDGTEPTTSSTVYTGPIPLTESKTIMAIAVKDGMTTSSVLTQSYTVIPTYTVTVDGTVLGSYKAGDTILLVPQSGGRIFGGWTVVSGGASVIDNKFTMPASDVVITGVYKTAVRAVDLKLDQPVQGGSPLPETMTTTTAGVEVTGFNITPAGTDGKAAFNTAYTMTATASVSGDYAFADKVTFNISGTPVTAVKNGDSYNITCTVTTGKAKVTSVTNPANLTGVANGTSMADILAKLPEAITVQTQAGDRTLTVVWDANPVSGSYAPNSSAAQSFTLRGVLRTDADLENPEGLSAQVNVSVSAAYSGGGGSITPAYPPIVERTDGGTVTVSPSNPEKGDKVTITVKPDEGKETDKVIMTDQSGNPVEFKDNGDGTYSFSFVILVYQNFLTEVSF